MLSGHQLVSELHGVGSVVLGEAEAGADVLLDDLVLDVGKESGVNSLLERLAGIGGLNLRDASSKELLVFLRALALGEGLVGDTVELDALKIDLSAGREGVRLLDALNWHAVQLERASDGEKAGLELLQEHDSLSAESAGEQDEYCAGSD